MASPDSRSDYRQIRRGFDVRNRGPTAILFPEYKKSKTPKENSISAQNLQKIRSMERD
jgi:hypothetical protein